MGCVLKNVSETFSFYRKFSINLGTGQRDKCAREVYKGQTFFVFVMKSFVTVKLKIRQREEVL
ncbi:MAG: hypothetical protein Q8N77_05280, partial [Nanoarchaeota archaeon]|nr:hypothetical protein [Nanoarchaeota archaeon]